MAPALQSCHRYLHAWPDCQDTRNPDRANEVLCRYRWWGNYTSNVSSCENLSPIGNLRDFDWDFQKLWLSPAMKERRKKAASGCFCTHESNSYYPSLPFNPGHLIQIKKLEREMKKAWRNSGRIDPQPDGVRVEGF